jgi:hypothetical protein
MNQADFLRALRAKDGLQDATAGRVARVETGHGH